jgi:hypothetical protein
MRNMSFQLTTDPIRRRAKTVTRRLGWKNLKPGDLIQACEKCQGLRPGEKLNRLCILRVRSVRREPLNLLTGGSYTDRMAKREVINEGFPKLSARQFVAMFCKHMKCEPSTMVTRIEFEYL